MARNVHQYTLVLSDEEKTITLISMAMVGDMPWLQDYFDAKKGHWFGYGICLIRVG